MSFSGARVLVVDDDIGIRSGFGYFLEDEGYEVSQAADGQAAWDAIQKSSPDLIISDLRMPRMDGFGLLECVRSLTNPPPVIVVSGATEMKDVSRALQLGASDYLIKPVTDFSILTSAIEQVLKDDIDADEIELEQEIEAAHQELGEHLAHLKESQYLESAHNHLLPTPGQCLAGCAVTHCLTKTGRSSRYSLDYFALQDRFVVLYAAEFCGEGQASSLSAMALKSLMNHPAKQYLEEDVSVILSPAKIATYLNREWLDSGLLGHVNLCIAVYDTRERKLKLCQAGWPKFPLFVHGQKCETVGYVELPVGSFSWAKFNEIELTVDKKFTLAIVSKQADDVLKNQNKVSSAVTGLELIKQQQSLTDIKEQLVKSNRASAERTDGLMMVMLQGEIDDQRQNISCRAR